MDTASLALRFVDNRLTAESRIQTKSDQAAQQLQAVANGIKAFVTLSAQKGGTGGEQHVPPHVRFAAEAIEPLTVQTDGKFVHAEWSMDMDKIEKALNFVLPVPPAATRPPASRP
jgi:hypothetical protein